MTLDSLHRNEWFFYSTSAKALDAAGIPHIKLGVDQQMRDFGQASTAIQAFADVL